MKKLNEVVGYFGNQSDLAKALGVTRQAVTLWKIAGFIPPGQAIQIEKLTEGEFKAVDLVNKGE